MDTQSLLRARRVVWVSVLVALYFSGLCATVSAAGTTVQTRAKLNVNPVDCTVDIVDDGTGQTLQIPAHSCLPIVPVILTPVLDQQPSPLPADQQKPTPMPVIIVHPTAADAVWLPAASASTAIRQSPVSSVGAVTTMIGGIGAVAAVTAVGLDGAMFELSHSKSATRWVRGRLGSLYQAGKTGHLPD